VSLCRWFLRCLLCGVPTWPWNHVVATVCASIRLQRLRVCEPQRIRILHAYSVAISSPLPSCCPNLAVRSHWFQVTTVWPPNRSQRRRVRPPLTHMYFILDVFFMRRVRYSAATLRRCMVCMHGWGKRRVLHAPQLEYAPATHTHSMCCMATCRLPLWASVACITAWFNTLVPSRH
jgi:hypothetical protein